MKGFFTLAMIAYSDYLPIIVVNSIVTWLDLGCLSGVSFLVLHLGLFHIEYR